MLLLFLLWLPARRLPHVGHHGSHAKPSTSRQQKVESDNTPSAQLAWEHPYMRLVVAFVFVVVVVAVAVASCGLLLSLVLLWWLLLSRFRRVVGVVAVREACRVLLGCVSVRAVSFGVVSTLPVFKVRLLLLLSLRQLVGFQCVQSWLLRLFSFPRRCCGCCVPHRSLAPRDLDHCGLLLAAASFKSHCSLCWNRLTELASTVLWLSELYTRTCPSKERLSSSVWLPCK